jgi:hypothetical protein
MAAIAGHRTCARKRTSAVVGKSKFMHQRVAFFFRLACLAASLFASALILANSTLVLPAVLPVTSAI